MGLTEEGAPIVGKLSSPAALRQFDYRVSLSIEAVDIHSKSPTLPHYDVVGAVVGHNIDGCIITPLQLLIISEISRMLQSRPRTPPSHEEKRSGEPS